MSDRNLDQRIKEYPRVALVLQGGGALGSYQAGVYESLMNAGVCPNWVAGISIGALNCAIIAGNPPEKRVERLHDFWDTICSPPMSPAAHWFENAFSETTDPEKTVGVGGFDAGFGDFLGMQKALLNPWSHMLSGATQTMISSMAAMNSIVHGQTGFFKPRPMGPGVGSPDQSSFYDTSPIIETLERFADFDRINSGETRVSLGATNVASGNFVYFDTESIKLTPKHFLASGSLPPGFPATEIDGEYYWDGGCVSNTPLEYVLSTTPRKDTLVFQVDLWSAKGALPNDIFQVNERLKDIQYSSRTRTVTNVVHFAQQMRKALVDTVNRIPQEVRDNDPWFQEMVHRMMGARYNVIHLIYRNKATEGHYKDYQFSHEVMQMHWQTGQHDMNETLEYPECLDMPAEGHNFTTFDIHSHEHGANQFQERDASQTKSKDDPDKDVMSKKVEKSVVTDASVTTRSTSKTVAHKTSIKKTPTKTASRTKASSSRKQPRQDPK